MVWFFYEFYHFFVFLFNYCVQLNFQHISGRKNKHQLNFIFHWIISLINLLLNINYYIQNDSRWFLYWMSLHLHANIDDFHNVSLLVQRIEQVQHFAVQLKWKQWYQVLEITATKPFSHKIWWIYTFSMRHKIAIGGSRFACSIKLYL